MADEIVFSRRPYTVSYKDLKGEMHTIRRVPPEKLHEILPTDKVELTTTKNADWQEGDSYTMRHIAPRQPNTLQIEKGNGETTFIEYSDATLDEMVAPRYGMNSREAPVNNKYLLWP